MSSPKTYTASDIERYHHGAMTVAEMHLLEKAALDDPMLADALEGYTMTATSPQDLQDLQNRLQKRINEKTQKKDSVFGYTWLKVAALVVVVAGGGWLVVQTFSGSPNELARSTAESAEQLSRPAAADSAPAANEAGAPATFYDTLQQSSETVAATSATGKATSTQTAPPPPAPVTVMRDAAAKGAEKQDKSIVSAETMAPEDLPLKENVSANTRRIAADTTQQADRMMQQQSRQADRAEGKPAQPAAAPAQGTNAGTAEPVGGWQAFENYLSKNTKREASKKKTSASAREVELQFEVDQSGLPVNIKVLQSDCISCQEEAIRLLKEGPSWKGKTGRVKITLSL